VVIVIFIRLLLTETLSDANASIAAKANEAAAAGSGASSFAPKRGYKLVSSSGGGGASSTTDTAATDDDDDDDDDDDGFTKMGIGKEEDGRSNGTGQSPAQQQQQQQQQHSRRFSRHNRALSCRAILGHYTTGAFRFYSRNFSSHLSRACLDKPII
jgi:hypothetical protein